MNDMIHTIYHHLLEKLLDGTYAPGELIPFEKDLAQQFRTNKMNAKRAVERLRHSGLVLRKRHLGTSVALPLDPERIRELIAADDNAVVVLHSAQPSNIHWHSETFQALEETVRAGGFHLLYHTIPVNEGQNVFPARMRSIVRLSPRAVVVFFDNFELNFLYEHSSLFHLLSCPVIFLNRTGEPLRMEKIATVDIDHFFDGAQIGTLLAGHRCRHILFYFTEILKNCIWVRQRMDGIARELKFNGLPEAVVDTALLSSSSPLVKFVRQHHPDAVIVAINNEIGSKVMDCLRRENFKAGKDYRLIAFDDCQSYQSYQMTSLAIPVREIGRLIGSMICDRRLFRNYSSRISLRIHSSLVFRKTFRKTDSIP